MPEDKPLTPLGEKLMQGWLDTGKPLISFLAEHRLAPVTWYRLLSGETTANGTPPRDSTVIRYCSAVGIGKDEALRLARLTYGQPKQARPMSRLGAALEHCRLATGEDTLPFLISRGLSSSTWYRLLDELTPDSIPPRHSTISQYAKAAGLDISQALELAERDRQAVQAPPPEDASDTTTPPR